ncbi:MAG: S1 RNA-binding domain-containing protein [Verrucomicrobiia bacterium]
MNWSEIAEQFPVGRVVSGEVSEVWTYGASIALGSGVHGRVRNGEIDWDKPVPDASKRLSCGQKVKVQIFRLDPRRRQIEVSVKRGEYDPWKTHADHYTTGKTVVGKVVRFTENAVLLEFPDHVTGILPRKQVVPWENEAEGVFECGDQVEVVVKEADTVRREIVASLRDRLTQIDQEIRDAFAQHSREQQQAAQELFLPLGEITHTSCAETKKAEPTQIRRSTSAESVRILVAENIEAERFQLCAILQDLGYENLDEAESEEEVVTKALRDDYDIILMDVCMPESDHEAGLRAARRILEQKPATPIVLVTGEPDPVRDGAGLELAGMLLKPIRYEAVREGMERFRATKHVGWPNETQVVLEHELPDEVRFMEDIGRSAHGAKPLETKLGEILKELTKTTQADAAAIIAWHPLKLEPRLVSAVNINTEDFEKCRRNLFRSPVTDLVYRYKNPVFFFNDIERQASGKFCYLRPILGSKSRDGVWPLKSCIGLLMEASGDWAHTLFLFGSKRNQFKITDQVLARAAGAVAGATIKERWILDQVAAERRLTSLGGIVTSVAHELKGRLSVMEGIGAVANSWTELVRRSEKLKAPSFVKRMTERIARLQNAKQAMDRTVAMILGWTRDSKDLMLDVGRCVENSIDACAEVARAENVLIVPRLNHLPPIWANPTELEQIFLNVLLNAIQHMGRSHRRAGLVTVETRYEPQAERAILVRFSDTGPGIHARHYQPDDYRVEKIYEPMFTTKEKGTGMGLYITRGLLSNIGGVIRVEHTAILVGTTFRIELPRREGPKR